MTTSRAGQLALARFSGNVTLFEEMASKIERFLSNDYLCEVIGKRARHRRASAAHASSFASTQRASRFAQSWPYSTYSVHDQPSLSAVGMGAGRENDSKRALFAATSSGAGVVHTLFHRFPQGFFSRRRAHAKAEKRWTPCDGEPF